MTKLEDWNFNEALIERNRMCNAKPSCEALMKQYRMSMCSDSETPMCNAELSENSSELHNEPKSAVSDVHFSVLTESSSDSAKVIVNALKPDRTLEVAGTAEIAKSKIDWTLKKLFINPVYNKTGKVVTLMSNALSHIDKYETSKEDSLLQFFEKD